MKDIKLRSYQIEAIDAIQAALSRGQKYMAIEMPPGFGKSLVFAKTVEILSESNLERILVVTGSLMIKEKILKDLSTNYSGFIHTKSESVLVENVQRLINNYAMQPVDFDVIIFYDTIVTDKVYKVLSCDEKTVILFSTFGNQLSSEKRNNKLFDENKTVFSYSFQRGIDEGYITPAMDVRAFGPAVEVFSKQLLEEFGYVQSNIHSDSKDCGWDLVVEKDIQKIWVECKSYKSQVVSPSAASSLLNTIVWKRIQQKIPKEELILLIVFSQIPSFQKDVIYNRHRIIVWDIENLVFYSKNNPTLLKLLSQITYFPIDHIEGKRFDVLEPAELSLSSVKEDLTKEEIVQEAKREQSETEELIQSLKDCEAGRETFVKYEDICEKIIRKLFETNYFNRLIRQHKSNDKHFRMDMLGALKINQKNEEGMHPLWQMLVQHYNSHFVVFEFKNYFEEIDQNLIYITEKYLFNAALRNVAIIISHKGFSESAQFAAEGCLKEHGKLILDITNEDLIKMLKSPSDNAADYLLTKLEDFLMGISK